MKNIFKNTSFIAALALGSVSVTGCIEETLPLGNIATADQVAESPTALRGLINGPSAFLNKVEISSSNHYDWGYGSLMHIRDAMTADMALRNGGHYYSWWAGNLATSPSLVATAFPFYFTYKGVQTANDIIKYKDPEDATESELGMLALGHAWRALFYLDAARMYEFLPNDKTSAITREGNDVTNLTLPIVKENMTEAECRNNPRATREQMFEFIKADLDFAVEHISDLPEDMWSPSNPDITTVLGLYARLYMWVEDYEKAAESARFVIESGLNQVMTEAESCDVKTGFNTPVSSWMLSCVQTSNSPTVQTGILNWTGWMSNECLYGYAGAAGINVMISSNLYSKITNGDWRRKWFYVKGDEPKLYAWQNLPQYASLKFRPGQGDGMDPMTGSACAYPMMRIEEMYFIEAEAVAHSNAEKGKALLEDFMKNYRNPDYVCKATSQEDIIREIIDQKSIEFFGEGISFFDIKRLNYSVDRTLSTNYVGSQRFKTEGRPAWMNFCLMTNEEINNPALEGWNNPSPAGAYTPIQ